MKRNLFWTIWGLTTLICVMIAGFKSFAIELEKENNAIKSTFEKVMPHVFTKENK
jgi:hypothetical protein